jgi:hypothetical protein
LFGPGHVSKISTLARFEASFQIGWLPEEALCHENSFESVLAGSQIYSQRGACIKVK